MPSHSAPTRTHMCTPTHRAHTPPVHAPTQRDMHALMGHTCAHTCPHHRTSMLTCTVHTRHAQTLACNRSHIWAFLRTCTHSCPPWRADQGKEGDGGQAPAPLPASPSSLQHLPAEGEDPVRWPWPLGPSRSLLSKWEGKGGWAGTWACPPGAEVAPDPAPGPPQALTDRRRGSGTLLRRCCRAGALRGQERP